MPRKRIVLPARSKWIDTRKVVAATRYHVPHPTSRVIHVAMEPRDHVYVKMLYGLARRGTCIEAHVEAVWMKLVVKLLLYDVYEVKNRSPFCVSRREPIDNRSPCNDEGVSR